MERLFLVYRSNYRCAYKSGFRVKIKKARIIQVKYTLIDYNMSMRDKPQTIPEKRWRAIRNNIIMRRGLTVHHIVPRSDGGSSHGTNLVTLCYTCHDTVEILGHQTLVEIRTTDDPIVYYNKKEEKLVIRNIDLDRPDWHRWVYGGGPRPTQLQTG
jgi:5-methylcytosine-specific restriction endonuclease McrA